MRVLVAGATGFVGSQVFRAARDGGHDVVALVRQPVPGLPNATVGDLADADLDAKICTVDVVIHAASRTEGPPDLLWRDNVLATQRLAAAVSRAGSQMIYVSTTGVYGHSFGAFDSGRRRASNPRSLLSETRARAEDAVLAVGGAVVRPHLVHGLGDRWVIPPLVKFMRHAGAWIGRSDVAVAAISAARLGDGLAALIGRRSPRVLHAAEAEPALIADLVRLYRPSFALDPNRVLPLPSAYVLAEGLGVSRNAVDMIARDSSMDSGAFWASPDSCTPESASNR